MDLIQMSQEMANELHKEALNVGKDDDPSYREGYLDCYNHIKGKTVVAVIRKPFLTELKEHEQTGRNCFCGHSKFCDC